MTSRAQRRGSVFTSAPRTSRGSSSSPNFTAKVDEVRINLRNEVRGIAALIVGEILQRVDAGRDVREQSFRPYSTEHAVERAKKGLATAPVDLRMTGGLMGSVGLRRVEEHRGPEGHVEQITLVIGPDTTSSRGSSTPHNLVGAYLTEQGRQWLGLSPKQIADIARQLEARGLRVQIQGGA